MHKIFKDIIQMNEPHLKDLNQSDFDVIDDMMASVNIEDLTIDSVLQTLAEEVSENDNTSFFENLQRMELTPYTEEETDLNIQEQQEENDNILLVSAAQDELENMDSIKEEEERYAQANRIEDMMNNHQENIQRMSQ